MNEKMICVWARHRNANSSAQKVRRVADQIRGKSARVALDTLTFIFNKSSVLVSKVLKSAIANAEHNHSIDVDELRVVSVFVDEGRVIKRTKPRSKGRADRILKRRCHINVCVEQANN